MTRDGGSEVLQGRWPHNLTIDAKGRLSVPAPFRVAASQHADGSCEFMVGVLDDPCLYLHTLDQHERFLERIYRHLGDTRASRRQKTRILSRFVMVTADGNGRITIPAFLKQKAAIDREVVIVGQKTRAEVWPAAVFERDIDGDGDAEELAEALERAFAEEERELRENRRGSNPAGEGDSPSP